MKKYLFLASVAALSFTACTNETEEFTGVGSAGQQKEIAFAPLSQTATRAADTYQYAIDGTTFPTDLNMYVAAYQVEPEASKGNYFAGTQFIYNNAGGVSSTSGKWGGNPARYWPLEVCYINFLAYANVTGTAAFDGTSYASKATVTQTDNSTAQTDLMYAIGNGQVTKSGSTYTFPEKVDMQFKHAQAWMDFQVKANTDAEKAIKINSITLNGAKYSGTYTITQTNYDAKTGQSVAGVWSSTGSEANKVVPGWTAANLTTDFVTVGKGLMIVPDDDNTTADWTSFTINYTIDGQTKNFVAYETVSASSRSVQQAKHYNFKITFKLHEIFVEATVDNWTTQNLNLSVI